MPTKKPSFRRPVDKSSRYPTFTAVHGPRGDDELPKVLKDWMKRSESAHPKLHVEGQNRFRVELPVNPPAGFQRSVRTDLRTPAEAAAGENSPFTIDGEPIGQTIQSLTTFPSLTLPGLTLPTIPLGDDVTTVGPDENVELNKLYRFHLEPDDGQPVEFIGSLIAYAIVDRGDQQRTWAGLYRTRGGKVISEIVRNDGRARNVVAGLGDQFTSVKVFDTMEAAVASIRSTMLRNQLLNHLGLLKTKFIE